MYSMTNLLPAAVLFVLRGLRFGHLRLTPYGLCAAVGLIASMTLARRSARIASLDPEAVWDAGLFAIISCFVSSRLLLVLGDPTAFARYPLLVLSLPSLTFGGMAAAALMLWAYLRHKRLPLLRLLDVIAAPGALLVAALELGHELDGSEAGMPTALPWGVRDPLSSASQRLHPVAMYGVLAALLIAVVLWRSLLRRRDLPSPRDGSVAALGLLLGGGFAFALDMLTQPVFAPADLGVEPGQWVALLAMLAGALLWTFAPSRRSARSAETAPTYQRGIDPSIQRGIDPSIAEEHSTSAQDMHTEVR